MTADLCPTCGKVRTPDLAVPPPPPLSGRGSSDEGRRKAIQEAADAIRAAKVKGGRA